MTSAWSNERRITTPRIAGGLCAAMGLFVLVGWILDIPWMRSVVPGTVEMKANTAVGQILGGAALCLLDGPSVRRRGIGQMLALALAALGFATLGEYFFGWQLAIDELLFRDTAIGSTLPPGRMSPYTAAVLSVLGLGLAAVPVRPLRGFVWMGATFAILVGISSLVGYLWSAHELVADRFVPPVAINTSVAFILLGMGALVANPALTAPPRGMWGRLSRVEKASLLGFVVSLGILLVAGGLTYRATVIAAEAARMVTHTQQVRAGLGKLHAAVSDAESQQRNYLLSGSPRYLDDSRRQATEAGRAAGTLVRLVADNPAQAKRSQLLRTVVGERMAALERMVATYEQSGLPAAQDMIRGAQGSHLQKAIEGLIWQMNYEEENLLAAREAKASHDKAKTLISQLGTLTVAIAGFMVLFSSIRREMTTRAEAEESLRRSEQNLAVTLDSIGDAVLVTDTEGIVTRMNPIAEQLTGWTHAEALGKPVEEVFHIINEETRQPAVIPVATVLATGKIQGLANHTVVISRDGTESPIADSAAPIRDKDGHILGVVLVFRDVVAEHAAASALRESEERYRTLFESIDEGFCIIEMIFDEQGKPTDYLFVEINPSFEKQTGMVDAKGKRMREFAPDHEAHWFEIYGAIAMTGEPARFQNRAEQLHRTYDVYAFRLGDPLKRQVAILFNDITRSKEAEDRNVRLNADLQARAIELESANKELEAFSYSVSHDLRAPLRHVHGYVTLLAEESDSQFSEDGQRYLKVITEASLRMGHLIDDLLAFSRMGRADMRLVPVRLHEVVEAAIHDLELATKDRHIMWKIAPLPRVMGDFAMLKQVFANLIGNAVKYSRQRDPAEIEIDCGGEEEGRTILFVRDNGAGFDMKYAHKLFGVFQRLHRTEEFEGTGIGLAFTRRIITRHGGRTWAEGRVNEGATFYFTLEPARAALPAGIQINGSHLTDSRRGPVHD